MADLKYVIEVDSSGAVTAVRQLESAEQSLKKTTDDASFSFTNLNQALEIGQKVFNAASQVISKTFDALDQANKIQGLESSFNNLQQSVGAVANDSLEALRKATQGTVSDLDLMAQANNAVLLGVDDGSGKFADMAAAAIKLGQATGRTATEALNDLTVGIGRQSKLILDNLGVIVDLDKAYAGLGENATDLQKKLAFQEAAFAAINEKASNLGPIIDNAALSSSKFSAELDNLKNNFFKAFANSDELKDSIEKLAKKLSEVDVEKIAEVLAEVASTVFDISAYVLDLYNKLQPMVVTIGELTIKMYEFLETASGLKLLKSLIDDVVQSVGKTKPALVEAQYPWEVFADSVKKAKKPVEDTGNQIKKTAEEIAKLNSELSDFESLAKNGFLSDLPPLGELLGNPADSNKSIFDQVLEGTFGDLSKPDSALLDDVKLQIAKSLASAITGGIDLLFNGGNSGDFGRVTGSVGGTIAGAYIGFLVSAGNPIGAIIGAQIGDKIGSEVGPAIFEGVSSIFKSGGNAETEARKAADKFFADLLDPARLKLVIDGQITQINDLIFNSTLSGGRKPFEGLDQIVADPGIAQKFIDIGEAINQAFAFDIPTGQLGTILASNLESLNNLQITLQATGISAEELGKATEAAYLAGDTSAKTFLSTSAAVEELYKQGIPGALGATNEAFENLVKGGLASGRIAWDSLGDLAAEAIEKQINDLPGLKADLEAQGVAVEELDKLWAAFAAAGINSIEDLQAVTVAQTAQIVSSLEDQSFAFEKPLETIRDISEALSEIPTKIVTDYEVRVKVTGDSIPSGINTGLGQVGI